MKTLYRPNEFDRRGLLTALSFLILSVFSNKLIAQSGSLDVTFGLGGIVKTDISSGDYGFSTAIQDDGRIIVVGLIRVDSVNNNFGVIRYNTNGSLDSTFGVNGIVTTDINVNSVDYAMSVAVQDDGKLIVAGRTALGFSAFDFALVRYHINGSLDSTFGINGIITTDISGYNDYGCDVKLQKNGKIILVGYSYNGFNASLATIRYNSDGSLDKSFGIGGIANTRFGEVYLNGQSVAIQDDGKIVSVATTVLPGREYDYLLVRYNPDGSLDNSFGKDGIVTTDVCYTDNADAVAIQKDGKIVVVGSSYDTVSSSGKGFSLARYNSDGSLDSTFDKDGKVVTSISALPDKAYSVAIQSNGKIIAIGHALDGVSDFKIALACYNPDGSLDSTFDGDGKVTTNIATMYESGESVAIQKDGKIVVAGFISNGLSFSFFVARYIGDIPLAIEEDKIQYPTITIVPNPLKQTATFYSSKSLKNATFDLYNMLGQRVVSFNNISGDSFVLNREGLSAGHYVFTLKSENGITAKGNVVLAD